MQSLRQNFTSNFCKPPLLVAMICALAMIGTPSAQAQTLTVLHSFTGGADGGNPAAALTPDTAGNFYGIAGATVFKLTRRGQGWVFTIVFNNFQSDDAPPSSPVIFGPDGALYGTTSNGGAGFGSPGTVFKLQPQATFCAAVSCPWGETILYRFTGGADSRSPSGPIIFDSAGNLYGTNYGVVVADGIDQGGYGFGAVWELVHSGGSWTINVVHGFTGGPNDGANPAGGVIFDRSHNLYGTTYSGGPESLGTVFELTPSGPGWSEQILHSFNGSQGALPMAGLVADQAGNFYGITWVNSSWAFELMPSGSGWSFNSIYNVPGNVQSDLTVDAQGNLYGANPSGGQSGNGFIFKLTQMNGVWALTDLYDFTGGDDGGNPTGSVILDASGNIYGTAGSAGLYGYGTVWMLIP